MPMAAHRSPLVEASDPTHSIEGIAVNNTAKSNGTCVLADDTNMSQEAGAAIAATICVRIPVAVSAAGPLPLRAASISRAR